jgi:signal transduction histidine kinase
MINPRAEKTSTLKTHRLGVLLMVLFYLLAAGTLGTLTSLADRENFLLDTERVTKDLVRLLEEHALRTLDATEVVLLRVVDRIGFKGLNTVANSLEDWSMISHLAEASPHIAMIFIADASGKVLSASTDRVPPARNIAETDYFRGIRGGAESFIGQVSLDPIIKEYGFVLARRLDDKSGNFVGMVGAVIPTKYFREFYQNLNIGGSPGLGVYTLDGWILVREPLKAEEVGRNMSKNPVYTKYLPEAPIGTYRGVSAYDGILRIVSYRKIESRQLLAWIAISTEDALNAWKERVVRNAGLGLIGLVVMLGLAFLVLRSIRREQLQSQALAEANVTLERTNAELERFAEIATHHLQEPLRHIISFAGLLELRHAKDLDPELREYLGYMVGGAQRMKNLLLDLQRYTGLEVGPPPSVVVETEECLKRAVARYSSLIEKVGATIVWNDLPRLRADGEQLAFLFEELIHNAIEYRSKDRSPQISVAAERHGGMWRIDVTDNGVGMEPQYAARVFRIFERLHANPEHEGTGIGLALCKKVVERHGGVIWVDAKPGEGSTFRFTLAA